MRAKEFLIENASGNPVTINIPISITIPSDGGGIVTSTNDPVEKGELPEVPIHVFPLQQEFELKKHQAGASNPVINQILHDKGALSDKTQSETVQLPPTRDTLSEKDVFTDKKVMVEKENQSYDFLENFDWLEQEFRNSKKH